MSRDAVMGFFRAVEGDSELEAQLLALEIDAAAWAAFARQRGFEFEVEELRATAEQLTGRSLTAAECAQAIVDLYHGGLSDDDLAAVAGGAFVSGGGLTSSSIVGGAKGVTGITGGGGISGF